MVSANLALRDRRASKARRVTRPAQWRNTALWVGRHELGTLLSVLGLAVGLLVFVEVADEVVEGETHIRVSMSDRTYIQREAETARGLKDFIERV